MQLEIRSGIAKKKEVLTNGWNEFKNHDRRIQKKILASLGLSIANFGVSWGGNTGFGYQGAGVISERLKFKCGTWFGVWCQRGLRINLS
jgi:hypothetical protein